MSKAAHWTDEQVSKLIQASIRGLTISDAADHCGRTYDACLAKAGLLKLSFAKRDYVRSADRAPSVPSNIVLADAVAKRAMESATDKHIAAVLRVQPRGFAPYRQQVAA